MMTIYVLACFSDKEMQMMPELTSCMHVQDYDEACDDWRDLLDPTNLVGYKCEIDPNNEDVIIQTDDKNGIIGYWTVVSFDFEPTHLRMETPGAYFNMRHKPKEV